MHGMIYFLGWLTSRLESTLRDTENVKNYSPPRKVAYAVLKISWRKKIRRFMKPPSLLFLGFSNPAKFEGISQTT